MNIFSGVKIVDLTKVFSGPFATRMFADYGAEVIKIENHTNLDDSRTYPPLRNNWSGYYEILNRNKRSLELNLKSSDHLHHLYKLVEESDVFCENLTPSIKKRLKIDYKTLRKINPKIIYASLSGKGQNVDAKYYDVIAQAESGLMSLSGNPEMPMKIGPSVVDAFSGMSLAFAISSALFFRQKTGLGQEIDVSMLDCAFNLLESNLIEYSMTKQNPVPTANQDNAIAPFGVFKTKDDFLAIAAGSNSIWQRFGGFLKLYQDFDDQLFQTNQMRLNNNVALTNLIEQVFSRFSSADLENKLQQLNIPCSTVKKMSDVTADIRNFKTGALVKIAHPKLGKVTIPGRSIRFSKDNGVPFNNSPEIGADNDRYGL